MPTIAHITWPEMNIDYGFLFKISSFDELFEYWENVRSLRLKEGIRNYMSSAEFEQITQKSRSTPHLSHPDADLINVRCLAETESSKPRSVIEVINNVCDDVFSGMRKTLNEQGIIYVNTQGGYFHLSSQMKEVKTENISDWVIPSRDLRLKQWPGGIHWYAYVGSQSVTLSGINKWETKKEAQKAAEKWANNNGITLDHD